MVDPVENYAQDIRGPRLALFEPDIPQNAGTLFRLGACLGVPVDLIEPAGFDASDRAMRRAAMDYFGHVEIVRHLNFQAFLSFARAKGLRIIAATTHGAIAHHAFSFSSRDIILLGRESAGLPEAVHQNADARVVIPLRPGLRSLNVALAGAMLMGEALRQLEGFAALPDTSFQGKP